jgi:DNA-binding MarR family transcriptional regulator
MHEDGTQSSTPAAADGAAAEIAHTLDAWYTRLGRQYGPLSRPQSRMLQLVSFNPRRRVGDLAESLELTTAGATRMVDRLEEQGYVRRLREREGDQREVYVALTNAGERALAEADAIYRQRIAATLESLTEAERMQLAALLARLAGTGEPAATRRARSRRNADGVEKGSDA